jgi:PAS domain-containing protein
VSVDFRSLFEHLPSPYMVLDRDLNYVAANRAYEDAVRMPVERLIGHNVFELFPDAANSQTLRDSFDHVFRTGEAHTLAFIPYHVPEGGRSCAIGRRFIRPFATTADRSPSCCRTPSTSPSCAACATPPGPRAWR